LVLDGDLDELTFLVMPSDVYIIQVTYRLSGVVVFREFHLASFTRAA